MDSRPKPTLCLACGALAVKNTRGPVTVDLRDGQYVVGGFEYERCTACGEEYYQAGQVDAMHARAAEQARQARGLLTPDDMIRLRLDLGLTQMALDGALGASPGTAGRWERGSVVQPAVADRLMRLLWAHPDLLAEVAQPVAREARGPYRPRSRAQDAEA
jgi:putative zinc finger/helix-turn-helix YgiT family protein